MLQAIRDEGFGSLLELPTLVVLEGGYSVDHIGRNTVRFLTGLEN